MFRLYGNIAGWKLLDLGAEEFDMMATMEEYLQMNENACFMIIKTDEYGDEPYKSIHGREDYVKYLDEYYKKLSKNKTCVELKREILDMQGVETPKVKKRGKYERNNGKNRDDNIC